MNLNLDLPQSVGTIDFLKKASVEAYQDIAEMQKSFDGSGYSVDFIEDVASDTQALILSSVTSVIIAFRGTAGFNDLVTDAKLLPTSTQYGWVHSGFYDALQGLWGQVKLRLDSSRHVIITGHSLGGALAQLCAVRMKNEMNITPRLVVTFAQPRVGFRTFAKLTSEILGDRYIRISKCLDFVPKIPPYFLLYLHPSNVPFKRIKDGSVAKQNIFDRHWANIGWLLLAATLYFSYLVAKSHGIESY